MNFETEKTSKRFDVYPDTSRLYCTLFLAIFFMAAIVLSVYMFFKATGFGEKTFFAALSMFSAYTSVKYEKLCLGAYLAKASFDKEKIGCTRHGKPIKKLHWNEIKEIVCVEYERFGTSGSVTDYLLFSGHELTDEEKKKSVELAGLKNDIVVVKYKEKTVQQLREIHDFSFADERRRDGIRE